MSALRAQRVLRDVITRVNVQANALQHSRWIPDEPRASKTVLTLRDIHALALEWTPRRARMEGLLAAADHWGPAHELGHALISTADQRSRYLYGLQRRPWRQQATNEFAAMCISGALLRTAGRADLIEAEWRWTPMLLETVEVGAPGAAKLLAALGPIPETRGGLSRLLRRRLGAHKPPTRRLP